MKMILVLLILFSAIALSARGELTDADLDKIRLIVKEEVKEEITASEKRTRAYIDLKIDATNAKIDGLEKRVDAKFNAVDKKLDWVWYMMIALIGLVTAAIAVPQIIVAYRDRGRQEMQTQIDQLRKELEAMQQ